MKSRIILLLVFFGMASISHAQSATQAPNKPVESKQICPQKPEIVSYYFHSNYRCETCLAVEHVAQKSLTELYGAKVPYIILNSDDKKNEALVKRFKIVGPALLVVKGDKVIDLTTDAFLNAESKPDKLKEKLKKTIDPLL